MPNERLYLKEIYKFQEGEDYFGLDVRDLLFFKMNKMTWEIIDAFPHHDKLTRLYEPSQLNDAVDSLKKNGFITPLPPAVEQLNHEPVPVTGMGLCMHTNGEEMPVPVIRESIDLLMQEPGKHEDRRLLFITDDFEESLKPIENAVTHAKAREKEYKKKITFALRTGKFPFPSRCVRFSAARDISLEIVLEANPFHKSPGDLRKTFAPIIENTIFTISPGPGINPFLEDIFYNLDRLGFKKIFIDTLCSRCRGTGEITPKDKHYLLNHASKKWASINLIPFIYTVLTSSKIRYGCRAGINYTAVTPGGDIYPCHHLTGSHRFKLGNIFEGPDRSLQKKLVNRHVDNKEKCRGCGVRYFCGGGPVPEVNGAAPSECETTREMAESAMITYNRMNLEQKTWLMGVDKQMKTTMPYRRETTRETQPTKETRHLTVKGSSMRPLLREGDRVTIRPVDVEKVKIGDIVCFGKPVTCHRVIRKSRENGRLTILEKGDRQLTGTRIPANEITGKVAAVLRGDRTFTLDTTWWTVLNRFTAVLSILTHMTGRIFNKRGERV